LVKKGTAALFTEYVLKVSYYQDFPMYKVQEAVAKQQYFLVEEDNQWKLIDVKPVTINTEI